jgi:hypothetical protein
LNPPPPSLLAIHPSVHPLDRLFCYFNILLSLTLLGLSLYFVEEETSFFVFVFLNAGGATEKDCYLNFIFFFEGGVICCVFKKKKKKQIWGQFESFSKFGGLSSFSSVFVFFVTQHK